VLLTAHSLISKGQECSGHGRARAVQSFMSCISELLCVIICVDTTLQGSNIFLDVVTQNALLPSNGPLISLSLSLSRSLSLSLSLSRSLSPSLSPTHQLNSFPVQFYSDQVDSHRSRSINVQCRYISFNIHLTLI